jgi:hypothetical protein
MDVEWMEAGVLLQFPFTVIKWEYIPCLELVGDVVEVEHMLLIMGLN